MPQPRIHSRSSRRSSAPERSRVARPWGRSHEGDVLQVTAVKEKPRRHNRSPRGYRDLSRDRRGTFPPVTTGDLPRGLATASTHSAKAPLDGSSMPLPAGVRPARRRRGQSTLRKLHTVASVGRVTA